MNILLQLILLQFCIVFVTDFSGFPDDGIRPLFKKWFGVGEPLKVFVCSLCQQTWLGLLFLLFTKNFTLPYIAFNFLLAALTPVTLDILHFVKDFLQGAVGLIRHLFGLDY